MFAQLNQSMQCQRDDHWVLGWTVALQNATLKKSYSFVFNFFRVGGSMAQKKSFKPPCEQVVREGDNNEKTLN